ncbi:putative fimbrial subunit protein [Candidatus Glomeribacter gigasporarum BEG34]|uniref:Putative fimbrial subunit protein n=1 Tax=Candidatus Glomeribacter gigasporarum BEG34 TaxID=1070319 RepID=G2J7K1_9BURK|nr:fimbrial protein [Candidatus Glomeribacter gigasporarum]CCD28746.1 putative fimbrial subunit protein [Candidatus Glomeribacter gigasporarum BEG34]
MKHLISLSALAISLASAVSVAQARENEGRIDGTIRFAGEVVEAVCQLGNEAGILDIPLNPAPKSAVKKDKGQLFSRQNINLPWNGCPTHNNATLTFPGTADKNGDLALDPVQDGQQGASGVAFRILNKDNKPILLNDPSEPFTLAGDATKDRLEFSVAYVANGDPQVKAGSASATLEFRVDYN